MMQAGQSNQQINCPKCGKPNRTSARFCKGCGGPLGWRPLAVGQTLQAGRYRVLQTLGKGGMGAVYLVAQSIASTERRLVLKEMIDYWDPSDPQGPIKARKRFEDEAAALAQLSHHGIPKIFDYFTENVANENRNFIIMEYVEGDTLEKCVTHHDDAGQLIPGTTLPHHQIVECAIQLCQVLEYLANLKDAQGNPKPIIHHDIKPANIILDRSSSNDARLVDFGTAKAELVLQPGGAVGKTKSSVYGTTGYAPPEQYDRGPGKPPQTEPRSDVYALAATLYHLITDDDPRQHPFNFPKLTSLSPSLQGVLSRALESDVNNRISAGDFRQQWESLRAPMHHPAGPPLLVGKATAIDLPSFVQACDQNWNDGTQLLYNRDLEVWLASLQQHTFVAAAEAIRKQYDQDRDRGMELFLEEAEKYGVIRSLRPQARAQPTGAVDFGEIHQNVKRTITIENIGKGFFFGTASTPAAWLKLSAAKFEGNKTHALEMTVDVSRLPGGQPQQTVLSFDTSGGRLNVAVRATRVSAQVFLERGVGFYNDGKFDLALQQYEEALRHDPTDLEKTEAVTAITILYGNLNRWNDCFEWAKKHSLDLAWMDERKLRLPRARGNLAYFCKVWADHQSAQTGRSGVAETLPWYAKADELWPGIVPPATLAQLRIDLALTLCEQGKYDDALKEWTRARQWSPQIASSADLAQRLAGAARELAERGQYQAAAQRYQQAQTIYWQAAPHQGLADIYFRWGQELYRQDDSQTALSYADYALKLDPGNSTITRTLSSWRNYTAQRQQVEMVTLIGLGVLAGLALGAFLLAWLIQWVTHQTGVSVILLALTLSLTMTSSLLWVIRRAVKRLLDLDYGGIPFIAGLVVSNLLWVLSAAFLGLIASLVLARLTFANSGAQLLGLAGWLALSAFAFFAVSTAQGSDAKAGRGAQVLGTGLGGLLGGCILGTTAGLLLNLSSMYGLALGNAVNWLVSFWNNLGTGWQVIIGIIVGIIVIGIGQSNDEGWGIVFGGAILLAGASLIILPICAALFGRMLPEWSSVGALVGACLVLGIDAQGEIQNQKTDPRLRWGGWMLIGAVAFIFAVLPYWVYGSPGGLALGALFSAMIVGAGAFINSHVGGPEQGRVQWKSLLAWQRVIALAILLGLLFLFAVWQVLLDRTLLRFP